MSDHSPDGAHERRGISDGAADGSAIGRHTARRDEARAASSIGRHGDDGGWGFYGDPDAQPDHGEENG
jgi:hypothetical protein